MKNLKKIILCLFLSGSVSFSLDNPFTYQGRVYEYIGRNEGNKMFSLYHNQNLDGLVKRPLHVDVTAQIKTLKSQENSFEQVLNIINSDREIKMNFQEELRVRKILAALGIINRSIV